MDIGPLTLAAEAAGSVSDRTSTATDRNSRPNILLEKKDKDKMEAIELTSGYEFFG